MRNSAFLGFGLLLIIIQSNLFRPVGWLVLLQREMWGPTSIAGITPSLILPLIVFMGVHEYSLVRGALLSFALGYLFDVFSSAPVGLYTFSSVAIFIVSRMAGVRLAAQTVLTKILLAFSFSLLEGVIIVILTAIFGGDATRPRALATLLMPYALSTAILAPVVFSLAQRVHAATVTVPRPGEVGSR